MRLPSLLALAVLLPLGAASSRVSPGVDDVGWMAGCWEGHDGETVTEEQWSRPRGGTMFGFSRTIQGDSTAWFEFTRIEERGDSLVFIANPSGQAGGEFTAKEVSEARVVFENLAHDFPQRVIYFTVGADSLGARIEGLQNGQAAGADFAYGRVACPGAAN
ncbi:MAG TPA: DUF6265 family protein [Longimicrobium sp.]|nr:DUF6265 family protein [Longimicrobium sp.]